MSTNEAFKPWSWALENARLAVAKRTLLRQTTSRARRRSLDSASRRFARQSGQWLAQALSADQRQQWRAFAEGC